jgi:hypothetical protein
MAARTTINTTNPSLAGTHLLAGIDCFENKPPEAK